MNVQFPSTASASLDQRYNGKLHQKVLLFPFTVTMSHFVETLLNTVERRYLGLSSGLKVVRVLNLTKRKSLR